MSRKQSKSRSGGRAGGSKSSHRWLQRQKRDLFVRQAQADGHVSRAHYKLAQIDERFKILKSNARVLELGAAPGGWTNYLQDRLSKGLLVAVDPLPVTAHASTIVIEGAFGDPVVDRQIYCALSGEQLVGVADCDIHEPAEIVATATDGLDSAGVDEKEPFVLPELSKAQRLDLVLSDMAPNISGVRAVDQARAMDLADLTLDAALRWLRPGGHMVLKAFQGEGSDEWVQSRRGEFTKVSMTKPKASRPESREVFVVAQSLKS